MDAFDHLPLEKKERIISAAMSVFAAHGYRKASVADIAKAAGISKAMVFTYFGSKRGCYEFMCDEMLRISFGEFNKVREQLLAVTDYFERIILSARIKVGVLRQCRPLLAFGVSVFLERDEEVRLILKKVFAEAYQMRDMYLLTGVDSSKFKNPDDAVLVGKMTAWMSKGCADEWSRYEPDELERLADEFFECIRALKRHFYKEDYI